MGRIFISAGHGGLEEGMTDSGAIVTGTTEAQEMIQTRDLIVPELRSRGLEVLSLPDDLSLTQTIDWINSRARPEDIALQIRVNASPNPAIRGATVFHIANNVQRKQNAELLILALLRRVPQTVNRGTKSDTATGVGSLPFCRQVVPPSLVMEIGFLTNGDDRFLLQNRRRDIALGIADGLAAWSRTATTPPPTPPPPPPPPASTYPTCNISLNGQPYGEQGITVSDNAYIPIDLADRLGVDLSTQPDVRRLSYRNVVYVRAIDLREFFISVGWDGGNRTVALRSTLSFCPGQIDRLSSRGNTTEVQLMMFLKANNSAGLTQFSDIARLYREEAAIEGMNYDIAFSQMCLETNFLRFGGDSRPEHNNFGGLGSGAAGPAAFPSPRMGVRAQVQHLKAYANTEPLVQEVVDPRFQFISRGIAPLVRQLSGRWSADPHYGDRIMAILKRLYEASGLL
jgi:N-acetylmuramoyl-L-alanine amidase